MLRVDSRKIEKGDTFLALKSEKTDGHDYIDDAISKGAACIIAEHGEYEVKTIIVSDTHKYLADYLKDLYSYKLQNMKFIAVTGTNGKTTSCYLIYQLLNKLGKKSAYIGTIGFYVDGKVRELANTTPNLYELYDMFIESADKGAEVIVMEASSQAIAGKRLLGLSFDIVGFTNLTQDHLDFHKTMENYLGEKQKLFAQTKGKKYAVVNIDDAYGKEFIFPNNKTITYGFSKSDFCISEYNLKLTESHMKINNGINVYDVTVPFPGKYNLYNYLLAFIIVKLMGFKEEDIISETSTLVAPMGRSDIFKYKDAAIIVDYAHTPDAVENVINSAKEYCTGKIITLVGCGGDRDKTKRPKMGMIATDKSDKVFFTNDNPRTEDEKAIMDDIVAGVSKNNYEIIFDRKQAIIKAISELNENDILLILGKGHEDYQIIGTEKIHLSDIEIVRKAIK
jgi:UDP-N-acetylmuramoyl-L-alanyl-D-glutamate--2,6-diaminopimelate ligase